MLRVGGIGVDARVSGGGEGVRAKQRFELAALIDERIVVAMQINPQSSQADIEKFIARAKQTYDEKLAAELEPEYKGKIVAIEPDSGAYFVGNDEVEAADKAHAAGCEGPFYFLRIGSRYTHRLMTPRR